MRMRRKTETLATVGLFRSLDAANIDLLDTQCSWRRLSRNQWIVDYQDTSNDVFFIVSGAVRVKLQSASGREVLLREINAGDFFGELAAIDNEPRSAGIIAVTDVTVARMPSSVFRTAVHSYPDVCDQLLALLAGSNSDVGQSCERVYHAGCPTQDLRGIVAIIATGNGKTRASRGVASTRARGDRGARQYPSRSGSARAQVARANGSHRAAPRCTRADRYSSASPIDRASIRVLRHWLSTGLRFAGPDTPRMSTVCDFAHRRLTDGIRSWARPVSMPTPLKTGRCKCR